MSTISEITAELRSCAPAFGSYMVRHACNVALAKIPSGSTELSYLLAEDGTRRANAAEVKLPLSFHSDARPEPACTITLDLEGHTQRLEERMVQAAWDTVRATAEAVLDKCVNGYGWGGYGTLGLMDTFEGLVPLRPYDRAVGPDGFVRQAPTYALNPDGTVAVAEPPGWQERGSFNVRSYLLVTVTGPETRNYKSMTDWVISLTLQQFLRKKVTEAIDEGFLSRARDIDRSLSSLMKHEPGLRQLGHARWWSWALGPQTPEATDVKYSCTRHLGNPLKANCESLLYQLPYDNTMTIDPVNPFVMSSGNCAIGIRATSPQTTTWALLRSVAETLLSTCIVKGRTQAMGGYARKTVPSRYKRKRSLTDLDPSITLSIYLQRPYSGLPSETCAWDVASRHRGDVHQCPREPWPKPASDRPTERKLMDGISELNGTGTDVVVTSSNRIDVLEQAAAASLENSHEGETLPRSSQVETARWAENTAVWEER